MSTLKPAPWKMIVAKLFGLFLESILVNYLPFQVAAAEK